MNSFQIRYLLQSLLIALAFCAGPPALAKDIPRKTINNLQAAYQAEANAANRYQLFAEKAKQDGYPQVEKLFRAMAQSELIHRENHLLAMLSLGAHSEPFDLKPVMIRSTRENLEVPIKEEAKEASKTYPKYIQQAEKDHADQAAQTFTYARDSEIEHENLSKTALSQLGKNPPERYYVGRVSGDTIAVPAGKPFTRSKDEEYVQVG